MAVLPPRVVICRTYWGFPPSHNTDMIPIRRNVLSMQPYSPGKPIDEVKRELGLDRVVKLASNENPFGPSPKAVAAVQAAAEKMHI